MSRIAPENDPPALQAPPPSQAISGDPTTAGESDADRNEALSQSTGLFTLTLEAGTGVGGGTAARVLQEAGASPARPGEPNDALLRGRLRAAAGFFAVGLCLVLAWLGLTSQGPLLPLQGGVILIMVAIYAALSGSLALPESTLRRVEFAIFALVAAFLAAWQYQSMRVWAHGNDPALVIHSVKTTLVATILLIFAYSMFIPNTWRSAARVVPMLALVPAVTEGLLYVLHPETLPLLKRVATPERVIQDVLLVLAASGLSIYGSHVIQSLRIEARAARELNQYRLVQRLGTGGMGEVYLAEHQLLKRPCAVKLIRHDTATDPIELTRFEREVRATARLSHPNTVEVFDYGRTEDGTFYYVMEYLRGLSLEEIAKRHGPLPAGRVVYLLRQVCGALAEAHTAGLVHRDVKPANVFACARAGRSDVAKLLDFGLVKGPALGVSGEPTDASRQGMIRGTPLYMAPEQVFADADLDHRCDIYALGGVAYRLLTGSPPFDRDTRSEVLSAHAYEPVLPPRMRRPEIPEDLERVILRCLEKRPDQRFPDADSLAEALAACVCASDWDDARAAQWWKDHDPEAVAPLRPLS